MYVEPQTGHTGVLNPVLWLWLRTVGVLSVLRLCDPEVPATSVEAYAGQSCTVR